MMGEDLITADNVSKGMLCAMFDAAYLDYRMDDDGDIIVKEQCNVYLFPDTAKKRIRLVTQFGFVPDTPMSERLEAVNKMNLEYLFIRASVINDALRFDYDIALDYGVTKKGLILMIKRFAQIPYPAVREHAKDIVS
jgi:Putative bacterial sensory transduction regulator